MFSSLFSSATQEKTEQEEAKSKWMPPIFSSGFFNCIGAKAGDASDPAKNGDKALEETIQWIEDERAKPELVGIEKAVQNGSACGPAVQVKMPASSKLAMLSFAICAVIVCTSGGPSWVIGGDSSVQLAQSVFSGQEASSSSSPVPPPSPFFTVQVSREIGEQCFEDLAKIGMSGASESGTQKLLQLLMPHMPNSPGIAEQGHTFKFALGTVNDNPENKVVSFHARSVSFCHINLLMEGFKEFRMVVSGVRAIADATLSAVIDTATIFSNAVSPPSVSSIGRGETAVIEVPNMDQCPIDISQMSQDLFGGSSSQTAKKSPEKYTNNKHKWLADAAAGTSMKRKVSFCSWLVALANS